MYTQNKGEDKYIKEYYINIALIKEAAVVP